MSESLAELKQKIKQLPIEKEYFGACRRCELSKIRGYTEHCGFFSGGACTKEEKVPTIKLISRKEVLSLLDVDRYLLVEKKKLRTQDRVINRLKLILGHKPIFFTSHCKNCTTFLNYIEKIEKELTGDE